MIELADLTRQEKSFLLYAETCCVEYGGLLEGLRMNGDDMAAGRRFKELGIINFGRVPAALLGTFNGRAASNWVTFTDDAWRLAHLARRERAAKPHAGRKRVDDELAERAAIPY
ncbi:hypothetical protein PAN31117_03135 [Pandoraea anapnoica]|uniref:Uncharacterized protein n=1 Tax=Pandoraea anapnoica TaxID=2508301 RepID=A0A5E5A7W3_9BURK|nr:hypothetical protein [Pandoraea anapnoica]VVE68902.1 hypothetical protein PAN31117_03135 [Pandoraea anapnoica]